MFKCRFFFRNYALNLVKFWSDSEIGGIKNGSKYQRHSKLQELC